MKVSKIKADARQVLGYCEDSTLYNRLTQAVEVLANEGQWDSMQAYMDIVVDPEGTVTLPRDVETPIKININNQAAFSKDKLFEFSLNGPGSDMAETSGWAWMDKGRTPVSIQPNNENLAAICYNNTDVGKKLQVWGVDQYGREVNETLIMQPPVFTPPPTTSHNFYQRIDRIEKDETKGLVGLFVDPTTAPPPDPLPPPPPPQNQVEVPVLDPVSGTYEEPNGVIAVRASTRTVSASLIYTTDGSNPSRTNGRRVNHNIFVADLILRPPDLVGDVSIKVIGIADGYLDSEITTGMYHITHRGNTDAENSGDFSDSIPPIGPMPVPGPDLPSPLPKDPNAQVFVMISLYYPDETEPSYRQIKLTKNATLIRMLYRKRSIEITSDEDWIPLDSTMAILTMLKALEAIRNGSAEELQKVDSLYKNAVMFLTKEQESRMQFAADAAKEIPANLIASYGIPTGQSGLTVAEIKVDAKNILGNCEDSTLYNRLTHAIETLSNEAQWDSLQAYIDIVVDPENIVTLPRDVETPLKININNNPAFSHDKLYEFTLRGPGNDMAQTSGWAWMDKGRTPVSRQPSNETLAAICYNQADIGKSVTVWGVGADQKFVKEVLTLQLVNTDPDPGYTFTTRKYHSIARVEKDLTKGYVAILSEPAASLQHAPPQPPPPPPPTEQVEDVVIDPPSGTYQEPRGEISARASTRTQGASISYTIDGTDPSRTNGYRVDHNIVTVRVQLPPPQTEGNITLKVIAFQDGLLDSHIVTANYHIVPGGGNETPQGEWPEFNESLPNVSPVLPPSLFKPVITQPQPPPNTRVFTTIAIYYPDELSPSYRQIKLTKNATLIRMLYRRKTFKITSDMDWIPLDSSMAILTMLKALESMRVGTTEELQKVDALYKNAVMLLQKEQESRMQFAADAQKEISTNLATTYGLFKGQTGILSGDLKQDARQIIGDCEDTTFYNRLTHAIEVLSNEGQWDSLQSYVDIPVLDPKGIITLPRDVDMPIKVNINDNPTFSRSKLYEFTLNGPGSSMVEADWSWVDRGESPVNLQPNGDRLAALCDNLQDVGKQVTVFGYDHFNRECVEVLVISPLNLSPQPVLSRNFYTKITKVRKDETTGQIGLFSHPAASLQHAPPQPPPPPIPGMVVQPVFDPVAGTYPRPGGMTVQVTDATSGASLSYTTDGSVPSRGHGTIINHNASAIRLMLPAHQAEGTITLRVIAFKDGLLDSEVTNGAYHIVPPDPPVLVGPDTPNPTTADTPQFLPDNSDDSIPGAPEYQPVPKPIEDDISAFVLLAMYYPDETQPMYRQIRISAAPEKPTAIRMLYRRRTYKITSDVDWIPLNSPMAILFMMRSIEALRLGTTEELQKAAAYKKESISLLQAEQKTKENFDIAVQSEKPAAIGLGIYNNDSIIANDVYDDACQIFGPIGYRAILDEITNAVELLANLGQWDGLTGYVDLITDRHYFVTLPRYIENVIELNINRHPKMFRNKWFEFHLNGPGTGMPSCNYWDDVGDFVTLRPVQGIFQPIAYSSLASDVGKIIIIYGLDENGLPLRRMEKGEWIDGYAMRVGQGGASRRPAPPPDAQLISRIDRILKQPSDGFIQLWAYERTIPRSTPLGLYYPDETEPNYRRIKLPHKCAWVRMRYRKRALKITGLGDPLHLRNRLCVVTALRAIKALETDPEKAAAWEKKAEGYLMAEQSSRNPSETFSLQVTGLDSPHIII